MDGPDDDTTGDPAIPPDGPPTVAQPPIDPPTGPPAVDPPTGPSSEPWVGPPTVAMSPLDPPTVAMPPLDPPLDPTVAQAPVGPPRAHANVDPPFDSPVAEQITTQPIQDPPAGQAPPTSRNTWLISAAVVVVLVVVAAVVALVTRTTDTPVATAPSTTVTSTTTTSTTVGPAVDPAKGGTVDLGNGVKVIVPPGALDKPGIFSATPQQLPQALDPAFVSVSPAFNITLQGAKATSPIQIELPVLQDAELSPPDNSGGAAAPEDAAPVALGAHYINGDIEYLPVTFNGDHTRATIETTTFSPFALVSFAWDWLKDRALDIISGLTGGLVSNEGRPTCSDPSSLTIAASPPDAETLAYCAQAESDGSSTIKVYNARQYPLLLTWSKDLTKTSGNPDELADQLADLLSTQSQTIVGDRSKVEIKVPKNVTSATIDAQYDGLTQSLTSLTVAADILVAISGMVGSKKAATEVASSIQWADCLLEAGIDVGALANSPLKSATKLLTSCFSKEVLQKLFGKIIGAVLAAPIATVGGTIHYFWSSVSAGVDLIKGDTNEKLTIGGGTSGTTVPGGTGTPPDPDVSPYLSDARAVDNGGSSTSGIYTSKDKPVASNGVTYEHALLGSAGCQSEPNSWVEYDLGRHWTRLTMTVGISDDSSSQSAASFSITVDGKVLATGDLTLGMAVPVDVDVTNGLRLRIEMIDPNAPKQRCGFVNIRTFVVFGDAKLE